jgi:hypothetical protein
MFEILRVSLPTSGDRCDEEQEKILNDRAREGWRLVSILGRQYEILAFMERKKPDPM